MGGKTGRAAAVSPLGLFRLAAETGSGGCAGRGPPRARQVGKTTLQEQAIEELLPARLGRKRSLRVQFDEIPSLRGLKEPILAIVRWYENRILGASLNEAAHAKRPGYLSFDEVQNLADWAPQIKALVDDHTVHVVVTGSSALRIEAGRDSLAGRVTTLELGTLLLREIAGMRTAPPLTPCSRRTNCPGLLDPDFCASEPQRPRQRAVRDQAFAEFSARGGYPVVHARPETAWPELADQLNETVIRRVIQHDLRMGERGRRRDGILLEEVFRLACRYAGQRRAKRSTSAKSGKSCKPTSVGSGPSATCGFSTAHCCCG